MWGNCTRITHLCGLDFYLKAFKEVKTWIHTGAVFPEDISAINLATYVFLFYNTFS